MDLLTLFKCLDINLIFFVDSVKFVKHGMLYKFTRCILLNILNRAKKTFFFPR